MAEIVRINRELAAEFEPDRASVGHKNTFGTALICAGSEFMTGAAFLSAGAALRSGAGLVKVFSEDKTLDVIRFKLPCALTVLRPEATPELLRKASDLCKDSSSVLIGSGIPQDYSDMESLVTIFLENAENVVLDAGALVSKTDVLSRLREKLVKRRVPVVMTPHIGEFARMTNLSKSDIMSNADELVSEFAAKYNSVVVLKSSTTLIATPDGKIFVNELANSGLAKGGSGDVLAGLITGFLAQGMEPYKAAGSAVYIHSRAALAVADKLGIRYMTPEDLVTYLNEGYLEAGWR